MNPVAETSVIAMGTLGLANAAALVYVVRRVSPWPKPPAPPGQPQGNSRANGQDKTPAATEPATQPLDPVKP